MAEWTPNTLD